MGMGTLPGGHEAARDWNRGSCDVMAVALHRMYGLPLVAEFERGTEDGREALGYLVHAWVRLPDGRALDAEGPSPPPEEVDHPYDENDPWVLGTRIVEITDDDPHLLDVREEVDYREAIKVMRTDEWIERNLAPTLAALDVHPVAGSPAPTP